MPTKREKTSIHYNFLGPAGNWTNPRYFSFQERKRNQLAFGSSVVHGTSGFVALGSKPSWCQILFHGFSLLVLRCCNYLYANILFSEMDTQQVWSWHVWTQPKKRSWNAPPWVTSVPTLHNTIIGLASVSVIWLQTKIWLHFLVSTCVSCRKPGRGPDPHLQTSIVTV